MNTEITYDQLKPHLTKENLLWVEDDATRGTEGHEGDFQAWQRLFGNPIAFEKLHLRFYHGDCGHDLYASGRIRYWAFDSNEIYRLPEAAMRELGLLAADDHKTHVKASLTAAEELREALGDDAPLPAAVNTPLVNLLETISDMPLFYTCRTLLDRSEFFAWPAAITHHHNREGGLIEHTIEVADIALHIASKFPGVNLDVLIAAALWHDYGKLFEYVVVFNASISLNELPEYSLVKTRDEAGTEYWERDKKAVHHCISSAQEFIVAARQHGVDRATEDAVVHCILSHHGPVKEWGSPVAPESLEAIILHQAEYLSAKAGATK
jgi:hypothetical protein